ncbi:hypothetical protein ABZ756_02555 [Mammaliicoccus sciuri]
MKRTPTGNFSDAFNRAYIGRLEK